MPGPSDPAPNAPAPGTARIWHNPRCSKSRAALARLEAAGLAVEVYDYRADPPSTARLAAVAARAGLAPADLLRGREPGAAAVAGAADDAILAAMAADPALIERPIVETSRGVRLARPADLIDDIV